MNFIIEKEKVENFIDKYFKCLRFKELLFLILIWIFFYYLKEGKINMLALTFIFFISIFKIFILPDWLLKETKEYVKDFYNSSLSYSTISKNSIEIICNLKKYDGPTFGILKIDNDGITFIPFRENLQNEKIVLANIQSQRINISIIKMNSLSFHSLFFRESRNAIKIIYENKKIVFQLPQPEYCFQKIAEKINQN